METRKYHHFTCNDFVLDDDFRAWQMGEAPGNNHLWEAWLAANPDKRKEVEKAARMVGRMRFAEKKVSERDLNREWKKLERGIQGLGSTAEYTFEKPLKTRRSFFKFVAAASVILAMCYFSIDVLFPLKKERVKYQVEKRTVNGQQLSVKLPDGTLVKLNAGSMISYPRQFADSIREVELRGEAFFEVVKNKEAPFVVHTGAVTTRVLGTAFNVRAYPEKSEVLVAVVEGKVKVKSVKGAGDNSVLLVKKEMVTVQTAQGELVVSDFDEKEQIGWKDGILYFEKADFSSAVERLERWYGVRIKISEKRKMDPSWRFSGKFKDKSLDYILEVMSYPHHFTYKIKDNNVTLQ